MPTAGCASVDGGEPSVFVPCAVTPLGTADAAPAGGDASHAPPSASSVAVMTTVVQRRRIPRRTVDVAFPQEVAGEVATLLAIPASAGVAVWRWSRLFGMAYSAGAPPRPEAPLRWNMRCRPFGTTR